MISGFRKYLGTWAARALFLVLVVSFGLWGVADVLRNLGGATWVAKVGDRTIEPAQMDDAFRRNMSAALRNMHRNEATPEIRRAVAGQTLEQLISQAAIAQQADRLGIAVPDDAVRQAVTQIPAFQSPNGEFDRQLFNNVLRNNGMTEDGLLRLVRADLAQRQMMEPVRAAAAAPKALVDALYAAQHERRSFDLVDIPIPSVPADAAAPSDDVLRRYYDNNPWLFSTPEYRRIKAVELTAESLAKRMEISEQDLRAAYDQRRSEFVVPAKRSARIIAARDEAQARQLASDWRAGAEWARMEELAKQAGATAVELTDATDQEFPEPDLAKAVFSAPRDTILDPVKTATGWDVVQVTKIIEGSAKSFDDMRDELRQRIATERTGDQLYTNANKVEDTLATGAGLTELPDDLGLVALTGTLDANGNTKEGRPAPIPGSPELRKAIIEAAFRLPKDEPPRLIGLPTSGGGQDYYAVSVDEITPPSRKGFDDVRAEVLESWQRAQARHGAEESAAGLLAAVNAGRTLEAAARAAGLTVRQTPLIAAGQPVEGVPPAMVQTLFSLKKGDPTMAEQPAGAAAPGFIVAVVSQIEVPDPKADPLGYEQARDRLTRSIGEDLQIAMVSALRNRARPQINQTLLNQIVQP